MQQLKHVPPLLGSGFTDTFTAGIMDTPRPVSWHLGLMSPTMTCSPGTASHNVSITTAQRVRNYYSLYDVVSTRQSAQTCNIDLGTRPERQQSQLITPSNSPYVHRHSHAGPAYIKSAQSRLIQARGKLLRDNEINSVFHCAQTMQHYEPRSFGVSLLLS